MTQFCNELCAHSLTVVFTAIVHREVRRTQTGCGLVTWSARLFCECRRESMAMLSARKAKRDDESGARFPAFVLTSNNLDSYRPWLKRLREWTRKQGGRIMEAHLIGKEVSEEDRHRGRWCRRRRPSHRRRPLSA